MPPAFSKPLQLALLRVCVVAGRIWNLRATQIEVREDHHPDVMRHVHPRLGEVITVPLRTTRVAGLQKEVLGFIRGLIAALAKYNVSGKAASNPGCVATCTFPWSPYVPRALKRLTLRSEQPVPLLVCWSISNYFVTVCDQPNLFPTVGWEGGFLSKSLLLAVAELKCRGVQNMQNYGKAAESELSVAGVFTEPKRSIRQLRYIPKGQGAIQGPPPTGPPVRAGMHLPP